MATTKKVVGEDYEDDGSGSSVSSSWYRQDIFPPEVADDNAAFVTSVDIVSELLCDLFVITYVAWTKYCFIL